MKVAAGQNLRVISRSTRVPLAFTVKSMIGSDAAQSWEGWAAVWITILMSVPYSEKIFSMAAWSRMSPGRWA